MAKDDPRDWFPGTNVTLRLVRAPITFGHTLFGMKRSTKDSHGDSFKKAASHIGKAIDAMHQVLKEDCLAKFPVLAKVTRTEGPLIKVLVLRASASEDTKKELKIHLVPYFDSHHQACLDRFAKQHNVLPESPGGLLGWIGAQEDKVDKWEVDYPREDKLNKWADETLDLINLAKRLHEAFEEEDEKSQIKKKATKKKGKKTKKS